MRAYVVILLSGCLALHAAEENLTTAPLPKPVAILDYAGQVDFVGLAGKAKTGTSHKETFRIVPLPQGEEVLVLSRFLGVEEGRFVQTVNWNELVLQPRSSVQTAAAFFLNIPVPKKLQPGQKWTQPLTIQEAPDAAAVWRTLRFVPQKRAFALRRDFPDGYMIPRPSRVSHMFDEFLINDAGTMLHAERTWISDSATPEDRLVVRYRRGLELTGTKALSADELERMLSLHRLFEQLVVMAPYHSGRQPGPEFTPVTRQQIDEFLTALDSHEKRWRVDAGGSPSRKQDIPGFAVGHKFDVREGSYADFCGFFRHEASGLLAQVEDYAKIKPIDESFNGKDVSNFAWRQGKEKTSVRDLKGNPLIFIHAHPDTVNPRIAAVIRKLVDEMQLKEAVVVFSSGLFPHYEIVERDGRKVGVEKQKPVPSEIPGVRRLYFNAEHQVDGIDETFLVRNEYWTKRPGGIGLGSPAPTQLGNPVIGVVSKEGTVLLRRTVPNVVVSALKLDEAILKIVREELWPLLKQMPGANADAVAAKIDAIVPRALPAKEDGVPSYMPVIEKTKIDPEISGLIEKLTSEEYADRQTAYEKLVKAGEAAVPGLNIAVSSEDSELSIKAASALKAIYVQKYGNKEATRLAALQRKVIESLSALNNASGADVARRAMKIFELGSEALPFIVEQVGIVRPEHSMTLRSVIAALRNGDSLIVLNGEIQVIPGGILVPKP
jgi:hypothetical protein